VFIRCGQSKVDKAKVVLWGEMRQKIKKRKGRLVAGGSRCSEGNHELEKRPQSKAVDPRRASDGKWHTMLRL
jgi:ribosome assembly protein YihI (activator of Der GTPase)